MLTRCRRFDSDDRFDVFPMIRKIRPLNAQIRAFIRGKNKVAWNEKWKKQLWVFVYIKYGISSSINLFFLKSDTIPLFLRCHWWWQVFIVWDRISPIMYLQQLYYFLEWSFQICQKYIVIFYQNLNPEPDIPIYWKRQIGNQIYKNYFDLFISESQKLINMQILIVICIFRS